MARAAYRSAFTLIELIVVVAIIAILLGMLLPSLSASREQARSIACRANLQSIGRLIHMYAMDNNNRIPSGPAGTGGSDPLLSTMVATNVLWGRSGTGDEYIGLGLTRKKPGVRENKIFYCPSDDVLDADVEAQRIGQSNLESRSSYVYRQRDMIPMTVAFEGRLDFLGVNQVIGSVDASPHFLGCRHDLTVRALALDFQRDAAGELLSSSHGGRQTNVVYQDGAVLGFENASQRCPTSMRPWATISRVAINKLATDVSEYLCELDRLFVAADWSVIRDPQTAPVPFCGPIPEGIAELPANPVPV